MSESLRIVEVGPQRREYEWILEEGFSGLYLWHAKRTLGSADTVLLAQVAGEAAGLVLLKRIEPHIGYVYYIVVVKRYRGMGVGGALLDHSVRMFASEGRREVYASIEDHNVESIRLFRSRGFRPSGFEDLKRKYGSLRAARIYADMLVVHGETLYVLELGGGATHTNAST